MSALADFRSFTRERRGYLAAFIAGFVSTLTFHQGVIAILHAAGVSARTAYVMTPTWPFHFPAVISLALWGGVWAIVLLYAITHSPARHTYGAAWVAFGATVPTLVALYVVFPLKGMPPVTVWSPEVVGSALLLNGMWGVGVTVLMGSVQWLSSRTAPVARGSDEPE